MPSDARMLIAVRVVVITTLLMAALIIQYTVKEILPINYLYTIAAVTYGLTLFYINMATNFAGYYATALLTSYLSEKLQKTFEELDVNRQHLAALRALNQNVVESIPSGLITLSREGVVSFINPAGCQILRTDPHA